MDALRPASRDLGRRSFGSFGDRRSGSRNLSFRVPTTKGRAAAPPRPFLRGVAEEPAMPPLLPRRSPPPGDFFPTGWPEAEAPEK